MKMIVHASWARTGIEDIHQIRQLLVHCRIANRTKDVTDFSLIPTIATPRTPYAIQAEP